MSDDDLCYLSAEQAIQRFKDGSLSPVEFMQALIKRAEVVESHINAFTETYFDEALELLSSLGAAIDEVEPGWDESIIDAAHHHWAHGWAASMDSLLETNRADLCDYSIWFLENARKSTRRDYLDSIETAVSMYNRFGPLMDEYDIFVCPTLMTTGVPNDSTWPENEIEVNGKIHKVSEEHWSATFPFNMLSRCPVMSMPSGLASNGVPTAIQFVARSFDDQRVFSAALAYEKAFKLPPYQLDQRVTCGE